MNDCPCPCPSWWQAAPAQPGRSSVKGLVSTRPRVLALAWGGASFCTDHGAEQDVHTDVRVPHTSRAHAEDKVGVTSLPCSADAKPAWRRDVPPHNGTEGL